MAFLRNPRSIAIVGSRKSAPQTLNSWFGKMMAQRITAANGKYIAWQK